MNVANILMERNLTLEPAGRSFIIEKLIEAEPEAEDLQLLSLRLRMQQQAEDRWTPWLDSRVSMDAREFALRSHMNELTHTSGLQIDGEGETRLSAMTAAASNAPAGRDWTIISAILTEIGNGGFRCTMELAPYCATSFLEALTALGEEALFKGETIRGVASLEMAAGYCFSPAVENLLLYHDREGNAEEANKWYSHLLSQDGPDALMELGESLLPFWSDAHDDSPGNLAMAVRYLTEAAELGSWRAALQLAEVYDNPAYGIQDPLQAAAWANAVPALVHYDGDSGCREACRELRDELHDLENALACIFPLADQGHSQDQCTAAALMEQLPTRKNEAYSYWMAAAQNGVGEAMLRVGKCLQKGELGVAPNFAEALAWFEKACVAGCSEAYFYAGEAYLKGIGTAPDPDRAYLFFKHSESSKTISGDIVE